MNDVLHWKKILNCVPFIDNGVGVTETQEAMSQMLAEIARLTAEVERLRARCGRLADAVNAWTDDYLEQQDGCCRDDLPFPDLDALRKIVEEPTDG